MKKLKSKHAHRVSGGFFSHANSVSPPSGVSSGGFSSFFLLFFFILFTLLCGFSVAETSENWGFPLENSAFLVFSAGKCGFSAGKLSVSFFRLLSFFRFSSKSWKRFLSPFDVRICVFSSKIKSHTSIQFSNISENFSREIWNFPARSFFVLSSIVIS